MTTANSPIPKLFDDDAADWAQHALTEVTSQIQHVARYSGADVDRIMQCRSMETVLQACIEAARTAELKQTRWLEQEAADTLAASIDETCRRYHKAVGYLAFHQTIRFTYEDGRIEAPDREWCEFIRIPINDWRGDMLCGTTALILTDGLTPPREGNEAYLRRFTQDILRLNSAEYWRPVAHTLWEGSWRKAAHGSALRYLYAAARDRTRLQIDDRILHPDSADIMNPKPGHPWIDQLDTPMHQAEPANDPLTALIPDHHAGDALDDVVNRIAIQQTIKRANLPPGTLEYVQARYGDRISRKRAPGLLGMTEQQVNTIDKAVQRRRPDLRRDLLA